jgi:hypothetical protein
MGSSILKVSKTVFQCPPEADCGNKTLRSIAVNVFFKLNHYQQNNYRLLAASSP